MFALGAKNNRHRLRANQQRPKVMCSDAAQPTEGDGRKDVIK